MVASDYYRRPLLERLLIKFSIKYANENILVSRNEYEQIYKDWNLKNIVYSPHCIDTVKYSRGMYCNRGNELFTICWTGKKAYVHHQTKITSALQSISLYLVAIVKLGSIFFKILIS